MEMPELSEDAMETEEASEINSSENVEQAEVSASAEEDILEDSKQGLYFLNIL